MTTEQSVIYIGIDVSKDKLAVAASLRASGSAAGCHKGWDMSLARTQQSYGQFEACTASRLQMTQMERA